MKAVQEKLWTRSFIVLIVCNLLLFLNLQMILPSFPSYVKDVFHASDFTVSLVTSLFALSAIVTRIFAGQALQKGKRNQILFLGLAISTLATAGYYWCGAISLLLLMRVLFGVGFGMASTTFPTMASNVIPPKRIGEGMGFFGLSTSLAMSIGPMIGLGLLGHYGFGTLIAVATCVLAVVIPLSLPFRSLPTPVAHAGAQSGKLFDRKILLPFVLNFLLSIIYGGVLSFMALFGKEAGLANVGDFFLLNAVAVVLVRPFSGKVFDKKGPGALLIPGAILLMIALVMLSFARNMTMLSASSLIFGFGFGALQPTIQAWMIQRVLPEQRGMANGMFLNSIDLGVAIGSMLLGLVAMNSSYSMMYRVSSLCMVVFLAIYVLSITVRRKRLA